MAEEIIDGNGDVRKLGLWVPAQKATTCKSYAESGMKVYTLEELRQFAKDGNTRGEFDESFVKDQKSHGSCNGFAAAAALTKARVRRRLPRVDLSGAFVYSLINNGSDDGSDLESGMGELETSGSCSDTLVTWDMIYPRQQPAAAKAEALRYRMLPGERFHVTSEAELFSALYEGFPVVFAVDVDDSFMRLDSDGVAGSGRGQGNHSVHGDGYYARANGELVADGVNSWNTSYGNRGRMGLTWAKHFARTAKYHYFYPIRSTIDDPHGTNPPAIN